jgi:hypothetical protein
MVRRKMRNGYTAKGDRNKCGDVAMRGKRGFFRRVLLFSSSCYAQLRHEIYKSLRRLQRLLSWPNEP